MQESGPHELSGPHGPLSGPQLGLHEEDKLGITVLLGVQFSSSSIGLHAGAQFLPLLFFFAVNSFISGFNLFCLDFICFSYSLFQTPSIGS